MQLMVLVKYYRLVFVRRFVCHPIHALIHGGLDLGAADGIAAILQPLACVVQLLRALAGTVELLGGEHGEAMQSAIYVMENAMQSCEEAEDSLEEAQDQ